MCLLAIYFRVADDAPIVVGANREEFFDRPAEPPQILEGPVRAVAGVDGRAGGSWLGVNEYGIVAAVTNRHKTNAPTAPRSRGLLIRDLLGCRTTDQADTLATSELDSGGYDGCNILCGDGAGLLVYEAGDWLRIKPLPPGVHLLTNFDLNDECDPRLSYARGHLLEKNPSTASACLQALQDLCGQTGNGIPPICLRGENRGTVSSTIFALESSLSRSAYLHAHGPPDRTPYADCSDLLKEIAR